MGWAVAAGPVLRGIEAAAQEDMSSNSTRKGLSAPAILCVLCLGLGAAVVYRQSTATTEKRAYQARLTALSNEVHEASSKLLEQQQVNASLERNVSTLNGDLKDRSQTVAMAPTPGTSPDLQNPPTTEPEPRPDGRMAELESERDGLSGQLETLTGSMSSLQAQMVETQRRLASSEGDRQFLLGELKRLQADKSRLQQQFNDLAQLRSQMRKLRAEQSVSRRLEWARRGSYGTLKGGELLQRGLASVSPAPSNYRLDVELRREGEPSPGSGVRLGN